MTRSAVARALASGSGEDGEAGVGPAVDACWSSPGCWAPSSAWPTSLMRTLRPSGVGAEDDVVELRPAFDSRPSGGDGELERLAGAGRLLADVAGGHLPVLLAQGVGHVAGGHVQRRQPVRVDPDPHAVVLLAELLTVADAVHAGHLVLDLDGGEVAQVELVVAAVGRVDGDDLQDVRVALAGGDAGLLDHVGQQRQGQVDAVLHQHLGEVQVDARLEGDGQGVGAVVVRLRHHVHHVFDAVDLLLDGGGDRVGDDLGVGAGVVAHAP